MCQGLILSLLVAFLIAQLSGAGRNPLRVKVIVASTPDKDSIGVSSYLSKFRKPFNRFSLNKLPDFLRGILIYCCNLNLVLMN